MITSLSEENKYTILAHLDIVESRIRKLHQQVHTGIMRIDDGIALEAINRIKEIRKIING